MPDKACGPQVIQDIFQRLLVPLWLRPERALWDAYELAHVASWLGTAPERPSLEYGCTDGIPTFVMGGGAFGLSFDDYREAVWSRNDYRESAGLNRDYFRAVVPGAVSVDIQARPAARWDCGVSWKEAHIDKARRLDVYEAVHVCDFGDPMQMLSSGHFRTVFAPNLFWLDDVQLDSTSRALRRVVRGDGRMVTIFPNEAQAGQLFYPDLARINTRWADDLDRGIHENLTRQARGAAYWNDYFPRRGWTVRRQGTFIPALVSRVYQIGLRPMFPVLMNMYTRLDAAAPEALRDLKDHWIKTAYHFLSPLCDASWMDRLGQPHVWDILELTPGEVR